MYIDNLLQRDPRNTVICTNALLEGRNDANFAFLFF